MCRCPTPSCINCTSTTYIGIKPMICVVCRRPDTPGTRCTCMPPSSCRCKLQSQVPPRPVGAMPQTVSLDKCVWYENDKDGECKGLSHAFLITAKQGALRTRQKTQAHTYSGIHTIQIVSSHTPFASLYRIPSHPGDSPSQQLLPPQQTNKQTNSQWSLQSLVPTAPTRWLFIKRGWPKPRKVSVRHTCWLAASA